MPLPTPPLALTITDLPALNAGLNGVAGVLLICGYALIKRGRRTAHRNCMVAAFCTSVLFLISYLVYHFQAPAMTRFAGPAAVKPVYLAMLASHVVLAAAVPPLALTTLYRAFRGQLDRHRRIARLTLPVWLYVSLTGVLIYLALYVAWPGSASR